ncbi:hypothetical protein, partial [Methylosinus sp. 3S-1]|uniref:hypothetical protein n=1 Tax=Methylosinus sp. 3S-1 TaxID=1849840 RepID=UPI001AEC7FAD
WMPIDTAVPSIHFACCSPDTPLQKVFEAAKLGVQLHAIGAFPVAGSRLAHGRGVSCDTLSLSQIGKEFE